MRGVFYKNIGYSFVAQFVQLSLSTTITLFLPLLLGVENFGYWQLFIFYAQYGGGLHFGLIDGIYLREGGKKYSELNYLSIGFQQRVLLIIDAIILLFYIFIACSVENSNRTFVIILCGVLMLVGNITNFYSMLLSSVNEFKTISIGRLCFSMSFLAFIVFSFLYFRIDDFRPYVFFYVICYSFNLFYCLHNSKEIIKYVFTNQGWEYKNELFANFKHGFVQTIANIVGLLLVGITRFFIDDKWGIEVFGMASYSLVVVNFIMLFVSEISSVMYPELRTMDPKVLDGLFTKIQNILLLLTPLLLFSFYPLSILINYFLPDYSIALRFMIYLLPLCVYEAKVMLQINTYLKVYNKPKILMLCNIEALIFGLLLSGICVYCMDNVVLAIASMPLTILFQYCIALRKIRQKSYLVDLKYILPEVILLLFFIIDNVLITTVSLNIILYFILVFIYLSYYKEPAKELFTRVKYWL